MEAFKGAKRPQGCQELSEVKRPHVLHVIDPVQPCELDVHVTQEGFWLGPLAAAGVAAETGRLLVTVLEGCESPQYPIEKQLAAVYATLMA